MTAIPLDYERIVQEAYEAVLGPGGLAVDVGAHVGRHTLPLARCVGPTGKVFAVEPLPSCRDELRQRLAREGSDVVAAVRVLSAALSDHLGSASMIVTDDNLAHSGLREVPYPISTRISHLRVDVDTIDRLFRDLPGLHFLKVDAEGAELSILCGGCYCLGRFRPVVAFEFVATSAREFGVGPEDMARFWQEHDYNIYAITGKQLGTQEFQRTIEVGAIWDYLAVPAEDADRNERVRHALRRPRVNWLAVHAQLNHASDHVDVGAAQPPLRRFRGPFRPLARSAARLFLMAAQIITAPQRLFNRALLLAVEQLAADLEQTERENQRHERRVQELERRIAALECEREDWDAPVGKRGEA